MIYTVTYAHLKEIKCYKNQLVNYNDEIGIIGNSGASDGIHLHIDCVEGKHLARDYTLMNIYTGNPKSSKKQLDYFISHDLFQFKYNIRTEYNALEYFKLYKRQHPGYDIVPDDRKTTTGHYTVYYNRKFTGRVVFAGFNKYYGNHVMICYDTLDYLEKEEINIPEVIAPKPVLYNDVGSEYLGHQGTLYSMTSKHTTNHTFGQIEDIRYIKVRPENLGIVVGNSRIMDLDYPGVNGTFFWWDNAGNPYPTSILKIKDNILRAESNHGPCPQSVLCYYTDGKLGIEVVNNVSELSKPTHWAIGGVGLYNKDNEGFTGAYADIWRKANHTSIGYDSEGFIYLVRSWNVLRVQTIDHMKKLDCVAYMGLDSGSSNQIKTKDWQRPTNKYDCRKVNTLLVALK